MSYAITRNDITIEVDTQYELAIVLSLFCEIHYPQAVMEHLRHQQIAEGNSPEAFGSAESRPI